jgi:D-cysteine desulfhydrase
VAESLPIVRRFPALGALPRANLLAHPTRVDRVSIEGRDILIKRDDLCGHQIGGNKIRGLDWLLGEVRAGDEILTVGSIGSTHALTTALCAKALGARTTVVRWNQEMNEVASLVDQRLRRICRIIDARFAPAAYAMAYARRIRAGAQTHWIPAGGSTSIAILGHANAALELAEQIGRGECAEPEAIVLPLGTGGTLAGVLLGARIAGLRSRIVGVRVVPRLVGRAGRVVSLANRTARLIEKLSGTTIPRLHHRDVEVDHSAFGGAYGRPLERAHDESGLDALGITLDDTYSRKAFSVAARMRQRTLFWLTFDARLVQD